MSARTILTTLPAEEGNLPLEIQFADGDGTTVTPDSIEWTLTDENGRVVRTATGLSCATTVTVLLYGDDLAIPDRSLIKRLLLVEWTFTSDLGSGIPDKNQIEFDIQQLTAVT